MANAKFYGTGRRKKSIARVYLVPGTGKITINKRDIDEYFGLETLKVVVRQPLVATETADKFDVLVNVHGGGYTGQAGAIRHGISRALLEADADYRPVLKAAGYLTRDPRMKERKKYGLKAAVALRSSASVNLERSDNERKQSFLEFVSSDNKRKQSFLEFVSKISKEFCPGSNCASGISSYLVRSLTVDSIILQTGHFGPCRRMTLTSKNQKQVTPRRR